MKFLAAVLLWSFSATAAECPREWAEALKGARQLVVMTAPDFNSVRGEMSAYERSSAKGAWHLKELFPDRRAVFGAKGMAWGIGFTSLKTGDQPIKKEGDYRSPIGVFKLGVRFGFAETAPGGREYLALKDSTECVDDGKSSFYNRIVDNTQVKKDWSSSELMRTISVYERGINVEYNPAKTPGAGSCIFLHYWRTSFVGTAGCGAMSPESMTKLHEWLGDRIDSAVMIFPETERAKIAACFKG